MPKEGYRSITVNDETYNEIKKIAEKHDESLADSVKRLLKKNCKEAS